MNSLKDNSNRPYVIGFVLSVLLTLEAYYLVVNEVLSGWSLALVIIALAVMQLAIQLLFFLHLGREQKPRWNLTAFFFAMGVVVIVVFGSIWIITNLNYSHDRYLSPEQTDQNIIKDEIIQP